MFAKGGHSSQRTLPVQTRDKLKRFPGLVALLTVLGQGVSGRAGLLHRPMPDEPTTSLRTELDRVGASFRAAGAADYISISEDDDTVRLVGPPREHPRRSWSGPRWQAFELLAALPDDAGVEAVWRALQG